jgi:geranylgeranyl diphosphate synthase type I
MLDILAHVGHRESVSVWEYPGAACAAVGGNPQAAIPGAAAVLCSLISIHLVDDILDDEPGGLFRSLGEGRTANLALAFQAAAHRLLEDARVEAPAKAALQARLAQMALATAAGQDLDTVEVPDEAGYWQVIEAKTPPLFSAALALGAILGHADAETVAGLEEFGRLLACFIQVSDDLSDALKTPAGADWSRPSNNLALLYVSRVDHAERARFLELMASVQEPAKLAEAQDILLRSGAISYCVFKTIEFWRSACVQLARLHLATADPLKALLTANFRPVNSLFTVLGVEIPAELTLSN